MSLFNRNLYQESSIFISKNNIKGEVLIADNGSDDGSQDIALRNGLTS